MLEFKEVSFKYESDNEYMMKNLSFNVGKGEFVSIIGASGCGKSTIFRLINGLEKLQSGNVIVGGQDIEKQKNYSAFMPQKDLLFPWRSIEKNLALPLEVQGIDKKEIHKRVNEVLEEIGLSAYAKKFPKDLSGGMKQRVSFGRTLLTGSELLLLDEPFSALDSLTRIDMQEWLLKQQQHFGKTILFITHDVEEAIFLSNRVFVIKDRPFSSMESVDIPLDYPRERSLLKKENIVALKEDLISKIRRGVSL